MSRYRVIELSTDMVASHWADSLSCHSTASHIHTTIYIRSDSDDVVEMRRESILDRVEELLYRGQLNGDRKIDALTALLDKAQTVNIPLDRFAAVIEPPETVPTVASTGRGGGRRPAIAQHSLHSSTTDRHSSPIITSASSNVAVQDQQRGRLKRKPKPGDALIVEDAKQRRSSNRAVVKLSTVVRRGRQPAQPADEPVYCLCQQVSFGEMIGCDNDKCSIEWFHFECVSLKSKPKGKWYCPDCRGDRVNMLRTSK